jgi:hypothetical protein
MIFELFFELILPNIILLFFALSPAFLTFSLRKRWSRGRHKVILLIAAFAFSLPWIVLWGLPSCKVANPGAPCDGPQAAGTIIAPILAILAFAYAYVVSWVTLAIIRSR